jgi:folate-dependent phosphoribosylglycinamide formyltransferase PurN
MSLEDLVKELIEKIPSKKYFDAHTIIAMMLDENEYHTIYLDGYKEFEGRRVQDYHAYISKIIGKHTSLLEKIEGKSVSMNIHGIPTECNLFRRN